MEAQTNQSQQGQNQLALFCAYIAHKYPIDNRVDIHYTSIMNQAMTPQNIPAQIIEEPDEQETGICNACGEELEAIWENNGFTEPEGPSHWEVVGFKSCQCRRNDEYDD